ncbi:MAG: MOSC domain-containing protein [Candidatus Omnitrophota bacterium]
MQTLGRVFSINISSQKGVPKDMVKVGVLRRDHGFEGDAHAGPAGRQVSLLAIEDIEKAEAAYRASGNPESAQGFEFRPGLFAENITTEGLDLSKLRLGDRLLLGDKAVLKVTQIGKVCRQPCSIGQRLGDCLMPKSGIFASVETEGSASARDTIRLIRNKSLLWLKT